MTLYIEQKPAAIFLFVDLHSFPLHPSYSSPKDPTKQFQGSQQAATTT